MSTPRRPVHLAVAALLLASVAAGCGGGSSDAGGSSTGGDGATTSEATTDSTATSEAGDPGTTVATTDAEGTTSVAPPTTSPLPPMTTADRSAPSDGTGIALLESVRVGQNDGFERVVFEFRGASVPGYRVRWVDGPITADGSGEVVDVKGAARLEVVMEPASGVDLSGPEFQIVYDGPDQVPVGGRTDLIESVVRTGDFEAVLTWVVGAAEEVPFRVLTLRSPTRVVVDLDTSGAG